MRRSCSPESCLMGTLRSGHAHPRRSTGCGWSTRPIRRPTCRRPLGTESAPAPRPTTQSGMRRTRFGSRWSSLPRRPSSPRSASRSRSSAPSPMSRSSRPLSAPACVAVGAVGATALGLLLVTGVAPVWAETTPGPVKELRAPSVDLQTGVSSLDGTVTVEGTRNGAKARIDATVLFGKDSAQLRPGARVRIRQVAKEFARKGPGKVRVVGYTDDLGPADHGLRLSLRRAVAVANTLTDLLPRDGYPMTAVGKGEQDPAVPNTSEANRRKNRRVVITLERAHPAEPEPKPKTPTEKPKPRPTTAPTSPTTRSQT